MLSFKTILFIGCVLMSVFSKAETLRLDPTTVMVSSYDGWFGYKGNTINITVNEKVFLQAVVRLSYKQVESIRDFLTLQVKMAVKQKQILFVSDSAYSNLLESPKDDSYPSNGPSFLKLFLIGESPVSPHDSGTIPLMDDDKISFYANSSGLHVILNNEDVLQIRMSENTAQQNATALNLIASQKRKDEFLQLALKEFDGENNATKILKRENKSFLPRAPRLGEEPLN